MTERKVCLLSGRGSEALAQGIAEKGFDVLLEAGPEARAALSAAREAVPSARFELLENTPWAADGGTGSSAFEKCGALFGGLDLYVNVSGQAPRSAFLDMDEELFHRQGRDWKSTYFGVCEAGRFFARQGRGGCIVLVGTNRYRLTLAGESLQGSIDAALTKFVQYAALEFAKFGVRAACIARPSSGPAGIPLGRALSDGELASWIGFLASPQAASMTGAVIDLDGGECLVDEALESYGLLPAAD